MFTSKSGLGVCLIVVGARRVLASAALSLLLVLGWTAAAQAAPSKSSRGRTERPAPARREARAKPSKKKKHKPRVLLVGEYNGKKGHYTSIQAAVNAAHEGDWILIGPGDYKQTETQTIPGAAGDDLAGADILVKTPNIHIRGMNRNTVMIDGTKPGSPECSSAEADQIFGPAEGGGYRGNNGIVVYKANGVTLQNFSTCNFLGANHGGDSVWFDGGASTGKQEIGSWWGEYLSSTSTYWNGTEKPSDEYGIYASNTYGPGLFSHDYANNMSDSGYYIGACPNCNTILDDDRAEANDLGYSGSNSGGNLIIENSEFVNNEEGVATTSQNNDDAPSPQEGLCPKGEENKDESEGLLPHGALAGAERKNICWVMYHNRIADNNDGGTPTSGGAPGLLGTGTTLAGSRNDLVVDNTFAGNKAWGILIPVYPGVEETPPSQVLEAFPEDECRGGTKVVVEEEHECLYEPWANEVEGNTFSDNGGFKNLSNGDIGEVAEPEPKELIDCWHGNVEEGGGEPTSEPKVIQTTHGKCSQPDTGGEPIASPLGAEAACDSGLLTDCPGVPGEEYPRTTVELQPLPQEPGMANPCVGLPVRSVKKNPWCKRGKPAGTAKSWR